MGIMVIGFFVDYKSRSEKSIYFVDYKSQADLLIYFVDYKSQAGWKTVKKVFTLLVCCPDYSKIKLNIKSFQVKSCLEVLKLLSAQEMQCKV